jgi:SSS family solute:Na+ symporter
VDAAGGLGAIHATIQTRYAEGGPGGILPGEILAFTPSQAHDAGLLVLAVFALQWLVQMNADGTGYLAQRVMACRSDADARRAALVFAWLQIVLRSLLWLPIGLALLVLYPPDLGLAPGSLVAEREVTFVRGFAELLPAGVRGLMLTAMLAALASTVDSHLNWGASYWTHDLYDRFVCRAWLGRTPSGRELVRVARLSNIAILAVALFIMTRLSSIQGAWQVSLLLGAGMGVPLVLRWLWWRITAWGEIGAIAASSVLAPLLLWRVPAEQEALRLLLMAGGATAVGILLSLAGGPEPQDRLQRFYERVRPPGFWSPIARASGQDPRADRRRLARGLALTAVASLAIFCTLVGLGSWLVGSPTPAAWPFSAGAWIALLLVTGLVGTAVTLRCVSGRRAG